MYLKAMPIGAAGIMGIAISGIEKTLGTSNIFSFDYFSSDGVTKYGSGKLKLLNNGDVEILSCTAKGDYWTLNGQEYTTDPTYEQSDSFDYIHDQASWDQSYANGGLKKYYVWSDAVNAPYKEDLWNTVANRAANLSDAKKDENNQYILDDNGNYIYENCVRCWEGAFNAPGAAYPWIVPYFDTDVNSKIVFQHEGEDDVKPWGDNVFGIGRKQNGQDRLFGCASIPTELGEEYLMDANGNTTFDISKFKMFLEKQGVVYHEGIDVSSIVGTTISANTLDTFKIIINK